jgi:hypothetical protein
MDVDPDLFGAAQALASRAADQRQLQGTVIEDHPVLYTTERRLFIQDGTARNGMEVQAPTNIRNRFAPATLNMCRINITTMTVIETVANQALQGIRAGQAAIESAEGQLDHFLRNYSIVLNVDGRCDDRNGVYTGAYKHFARPAQVADAIMYYLGGRWAGIRHVNPRTFEFTLDIQAPGENFRLGSEQRIGRWTLMGSITGVDESDRPGRVFITVFHFGPAT